MFAQASAPIGWTRVGGEAENNRMLRVVGDGTGGSFGGSASPILNNVVPSHTHSFGTGNQSADHTHTFSTGNVSSDHNHLYTASNNGNIPRINGIFSPGVNSGVFTAGTGSMSANHFHSGTTANMSNSHSHSGTTDNGSSQTNWSPRYINMILCSKN